MQGFLIVAANVLWAVAASKYRLIIDAGSSGSRLRLFNRTEVGLVAVHPSVLDEASFETEPGLSSYTGHPEDAGTSLQALIDGAKRYVPPAEWGSTPLWVKATAGLRLLPAKELRGILEGVRAYMGKPENCAFHFKSIDVLAGEEEGIFAYLGMTSMLQGTPGSDQPSGILDLGGASLQVAFKPADNILDGEFQFYLDRKRQAVYVRSFPQFGLDAALRRAQEQVARQAPKHATAVQFPCFNPGHNHTEQIDGRSVVLVGTGEGHACAELARSLMHEDYECLLPPCPFMGVHVPSFKGRHFYGLSSFFYVSNGLGLLGWHEARPVRPAEIKAATAAFCGMSIQHAMEHSGQILKYTQNFCFGGHYISQLLRAYGFEDNATSITMLRALHNDAADWTLGAVQYETEHMPALLAEPKPLPCDIAAPPSEPVLPALRGGSMGGMPTILGAPGWSLWLAGVFAASLFGWSVHLLPGNCCSRGTHGAFYIPDAPMSPVSAYSPTGVGPPKNLLGSPTNGAPPNLLRFHSTPDPSFLPGVSPSRSRQQWSRKFIP